MLSPVPRVLGRCGVAFPWVMFPRQLVYKWLITGGLQLLSGVKFVWRWRALSASAQRKTEALRTVGKLSSMASYGFNSEKGYLGNQGLLMRGR